MNRLNIVDFGAAADGKTVCTQAIRRAIDACPAGGTVLIPAGTFVSGSIYLKSDMELYLEEGALLLGSDNPDDYPVIRDRDEGWFTKTRAALVEARMPGRDAPGAPYREGVGTLDPAALWGRPEERLHDIRIRGNGEICGNGPALAPKEAAQGRNMRGTTINIRNADRVHIEGVTFSESPFWCMHFLFCEDLTLENVRVRNKFHRDGVTPLGLPNNDGIDPDSCRHVTIRNCDIESEDDNIAIKAGRDREGRAIGIRSEHITIENCTFRHGFGVACGSEMSAGIRDVAVRGCTFQNSFSIAAIKSKPWRGGVIEDVRIEHCRLVNEATDMRECKWFRGALNIDLCYGIEEEDLPENRRRGALLGADFTGESEKDENGMPQTDERERLQWEELIARGDRTPYEFTPAIRHVEIHHVTIRTCEGKALYIHGLPESPVQDLTLEDIQAEGRGAVVRYAEDVKLTDCRLSLL